MMSRLVFGCQLGRCLRSLPLSAGWELGLLSDFAINIDDLEFLQEILVDACNELKIPPDHQGFVARVVDLRFQGHSREEILRSLRAEFASLPDRGQKHAAINP